MYLIVIEWEYTCQFLFLGPDGEFIMSPIPGKFLTNAELSSVELVNFSDRSFGA